MRYAGIEITEVGWVSHRHGAGTVAGVRARVETAAAIDLRLSAGRVSLNGALYLLWKTRIHPEATFLTLEGDGYSIAVALGADDRPKARAFAAEVDALGRREPPRLRLAVWTDGPRAPHGCPVDRGGQLLQLAQLHAVGVLDDRAYDAAKVELCR